MPDHGKTRALVTGGAGFLGQHLVQQLIDSGNWDVTVFDIREAKIVGAKTIIGDLRQADQVKTACNGIEVVFHCATAAPTGSNALNKSLMDGVNIEGTRNIVAGCQAAGVKRLVSTSSASVVFEGRTLKMVDESHPYATKPMDYYTQTKIEGEKLVLAANGMSGVATCALRPSGIFGENDPLFVPTVAKQAERGKMKFIIGNGRNEMDFTYVGNVAQAHIEAAAALSLGGNVAGKAFFITNQEPLPFWTMMGNVVEGLGYGRPRIHLPYVLIIFVAFVFEYIIRPLVKPFKTLETDFTVNRILLATTERTFSSESAKKAFGYKPRVSLKEGIARTIRSFQHLKKSSGEDVKLMKGH